METTTSLQKEILKKIRNGDYRDFYLIYDRKSTDEPDNQKNSIAYQRAENLRFAAREKVRIAPITIPGFCLDGIISERHSGFKEDNNVTVTRDGYAQYKIERPKFQKLVQFLSTGKFKGIICLCWDRVSRNKGDDAIIRKLMRKGIDVRFTFAKYEDTSSGALHMDIDGMFAEHHSRVTAEKVSTTIWELREQGICTYRAPLGYLNTGDMKNKPFDPVRSPIIKRLFELCAKGTWTLSDLSRWANEQGLTTMPMRRRRTEEEQLAEEEDDKEIEKISRMMTPTMIHKILTNRFYIGLVLGNDNKFVPSKSHLPLVTEKLFSIVQKLLTTRKTSVHYVQKLELPYRGMVRCEGCTRGYTPYVQKGTIYFSSRCRELCPNPFKNFNQEGLEGFLRATIDRLTLSPVELDKLDGLTKTDVSQIDDSRRKTAEESERIFKKLKEDIEYLQTNKLTLLKTGAYSPQAILVEENQLNERMALALEGKGVQALTQASLEESLKNALKLSELLKRAYLYYPFGNSAEKEAILRILFSELWISGNTLKTKCKSAISPFQTRHLILCDPTGWLSELFDQREEVGFTVKELGSLLRKGNRRRTAKIRRSSILNVRNN